MFSFQGDALLRANIHRLDVSIVVEPSKLAPRSFSFELSDAIFSISRSLRLSSPQNDGTFVSA